MSEEMKKSLAEAAMLFSQAAPRRSENSSESTNGTGLCDASSLLACDKSSNTTDAIFSIKDSMFGAKSFFEQASMSAEEREKAERLRTEKKKAEELKEQIRREIKVKQTVLDRDVKGAMLCEFGEVANEIMPLLSGDTFLRKSMLEFMSKYLAMIAQESTPRIRINAGIEVDKEEVIRILKNHSDIIESKICARYEQYKESLNEDSKIDLSVEAKNSEKSINAEKEYLILQYKSLFYEYIACLEKKLENIRSIPEDLF